jgi:hypothetical protein
VQAGVLLDVQSQAHLHGAGGSYSRGRRTLDGPFAETKELLAGYTRIKVNSREEAIEWTKRFPNPAGEGKDAEVEVRQLFELEDFAPGDAVDRFRDMGLDSKR